MELDSTSKRTNFVFSIKKFLIESLYDALGILCIFDEFTPPADSVNQWIFVDFGPLNRSTVSEFSFEIYCVTRSDFDGDRLSQLIDIVVGLFTDNTTTDGFKRIPFYDYSNQIQNGSLIVVECSEGQGGMEAPDKSKFMILTPIVRMASK